MTAMTAHSIESAHHLKMKKSSSLRSVDVTFSNGGDHKLIHMHIHKPQGFKENSFGRNAINLHQKGQRL